MSDRSDSIDKNSNVQSALHEWKSTRTLLSNAIQSFQTACVALNAACVGDLSSPNDRTELEDALTDIDSELESLAAEETKLLKERTLLASTRNISAKLVRINTLPLEVLARVFAFSNTCHTQTKSVRLYRLSRVCTRWRQLVINTLNLWSHVDVGLNVPIGRTKLFLERSKNRPIYVHLHDIDDPEQTKLTNTASIVRVLEPHIHRAYILDLVSCIGRNLPLSVVDLWLKQGNPALSKSLLMSLPHTNKHVVTDSLNIAGLRIGDSENARRILQSLTTLHLEAAYFTWNSGAYYGILDLRIKSNYRPIRVTESKLYDVLSSSPGLKILKLENMDVSKTEGWTKPATLMLNHLQVLSLGSFKSEGLPMMLSMLTLPAECEVGIGGVNAPHHEMSAFFSRSRITTLYLDCCGSDSLPSWIALLSILPCIRTIILDCLNTKTPDMDNQPPITWSHHLHTVIVLCSKIELECLNHLVCGLGIRNLRLEGCGVYRTSQYLEGVRTSLLEAYPEVQCTISDRDSTLKMPCRAMFDD